MLWKTHKMLGKTHETIRNTNILLMLTEETKASIIFASMINKTNTAITNLGHNQKPGIGIHDIDMNDIT